MDNSTDEAARALAAEFDIQEEANTIEPSLLDRAKFSTLHKLSPGQDYKDGVLYYTAPFFINTTRKKGKGKDAVNEPVIETHTACISSEREMFLFDRTNLFERGFSYPEVFLAPSETAWGGNILTDIADKKVKDPDPYDLFFRVRKLYEKYMEFSDERYFDLMTAWVMGSYVFRIFRSYAYLHFNGTKDSGKSQNLRILKAIGFNTQWTGEMTSADLYRGIAGNPGVICIDEQEKWRGEKADALKSILRSGYAEGLEVTRQRQLPDGVFVRDSFPIYSPKALASISPLDNTTQSRTIVVHMRPALRSIPEFDAGRVERWRGLRDDLHIFGLNHAKGIKETYDAWSSPHNGHRFTRAPELTNRAWEISAAIVVVADYIGGEAFSQPLIEWLGEYFKQQRKQEDSSDIARLLAISLPSVLRNVPAQEGWWYSIKSIVNQMNDIINDESFELKSGTVTKYLKPLGFNSFRVAKNGREVQLEEANVRRVFTERRIEPMMDDIAWLSESTDYQDEDKIPEMSTQIGWEDATER